MPKTLFERMSEAARGNRSDATPSEIAATLTPSERKALLTRDGHGEFSSSTYEKLLGRGLVDTQLHWTDLGCDVRDALRLLNGSVGR